MDYSYFILHPSPPTNGLPLELSNRAYDLWEKTWVETFEKTGFSDHLVRDHFLRCNKLALITDPFKNIVGLHLYTFMNFHSKSCQASGFFADIKSEFRNYFIERGFNTGNCMEYLTVNPKYRKSRTGIPFGEILIGLGVQITREEGLDCSFGTSREDVKVHKMTQSLGAEILLGKVSKYGYSCCITLASSSAPSQPGYEDRDEIINQLWKHRTDYTQKAPKGHILEENLSSSTNVGQSKKIMKNYLNTRSL